MGFTRKLRCEVIADESGRTSDAGRIGHLVERQRMETNQRDRLACISNIERLEQCV